MIYRFGAFDLDADKFELRKDDRRVAVEPQVFSIIQLLIENRHRMVSKSELMDAVWQGRIVSESAVSSRIRSARSALEDTGKSQRIIQTVHGKGLRFIADVDACETPGAPNGHFPAANAADFDDPGIGALHPTRRAKDRPSIAVLPFENLSASGEDSFFAAGLTEDVTTNLSRFRDLFVFSRSTTTALANEGMSIQKLHDRLGIDFAIEGSVRKSAVSVRVTVKLIDAATDGNILVERFEDECTLENIFEIQDRIALLIAGRIANRRELLREPVSADAPLTRATKWETYHWIAQFYEYMRTRDSELHAAVRNGLGVAISDDPVSSDGRAALAVVLLDEHRFGMNTRPGYPVLDLAYEHARRSISSDTHNAFAHQALAMVQYHRKEFDEFQEAADKSVTLNPGKADALAAFGCCYYLAGHVEKALSFLDEAIELNPLENGSPRLVRAGCFFMQNRYEDAWREIKKASMPGLIWYHAYLATISHKVGQTETTDAEVRLIGEQFPDFISHLETQKDVLNISTAVDKKFGDAWQEIFAS